MFKMRKVSLLMMAAIVAASSVFVSCSKDDDPYVAKDAPEISVTFGGDDVAKSATVPLKIGEEKKLVVSYEAAGGVKDIEFGIGTQSPTVPFTAGSTSGSFSIDLTGEVKGPLSVTIKVTDNQGTASEGLPDAISDLYDTFSFTINVVENALEEADFVFEWSKSGTQATIGGIADFGLDWYAVTGDPLLAQIRPIVDSGNEWYKFADTDAAAADAVYNGITTKEALKALFTADKKQTGNFTISVNNVNNPNWNVVIGTKVGNEYYLLRINRTQNVDDIAGSGFFIRKISGKAKW